MTGHGSFATGMTSALKLIVGELKDYVPVDFASLDGVAELERNLKDAYHRLSDCEGILVFCDLVGGSPFKTAVTLAAERTDVRVIAGTNLGSLVETYMSRDSVSDLDELKNLALDTARSQVIEFKMQSVEPEPEDGDGI